jgi:lysophospholipid acyltransferase (LPLAT)-like uncharacterized protein
VSDPAADLPETPAVVPWYHWLWVAPFALLLRLWLATLRVRSNRPAVDDADGGRIIVLWHDRLFVAGLVAHLYFKRPINALISTSKDGGWLVAFFRLMGLKAVRGSSSKRGAAALMTLTRVVRAGEHAGITPDGPKGPARICKTGPVALAKLTGRPILIMGLDYARCWRLRNWDRFALPWPFSRVDVTFEDFPAPSRADEDAAVAERIQERLNALSGR